MHAGCWKSTLCAPRTRYTWQRHWLVVVEERTDSIQFVTFDSRLAEAAAREGFEVPRP